MPPKAKFTKEDIASAAFALVREQGIEALTARSLAARLGSSPKPIFGLFTSMEELQAAVIQKAQTLFSERIRREMEEGRFPPYNASGMAYVRFAQEERHLFKLLYMRDRSGEPPMGEDPNTALMIRLIQKGTGLSKENAWLLHLETWIYVHGIATMVATSYLDWEEDFVSRSLTDLYEGLKFRFQKGDTQ